LAKGRSEKDPSASETAGRGLTRTIFSTLLLIASLGVLLGWVWQGVYRLDPGESAVILRFGAYERTQIVEGLGWHWPPPLESHEVVNTSELRTESFGAQPSQSTPGIPVDAEELEIAEKIKRDAVQTGDGNIVNVAYELQYKVANAFAYRFAMAEPSAVLHDATEAAMRAVIGKKTIDSVLSQNRSQIEREVRSLLESMLGSYLADVGYEAAFEVGRINLEKPQAPEAVRAAFADVVSAGQDEKRSSLEAAGDAQETLERARSEVAEIREQAEAFKRARIIEARGEATRFVALLVEYHNAPEVTRRRLYLETMEEILPGIDKMIIEPNTVNMLPLLPLRNQTLGVGANQ
jgi:membrane protease subunit HflK